MLYLGAQECAVLCLFQTGAGTMLDGVGMLQDFSSSQGPTGGKTFFLPLSEVPELPSSTHFRAMVDR